LIQKKRALGLKIRGLETGSSCEVASTKIKMGRCGDGEMG